MNQRHAIRLKFERKRTGEEEEYQEAVGGKVKRVVAIG
jgi:hypothetical protein